jgi:hypothetical protein
VVEGEAMCEHDNGGEGQRGVVGCFFLFILVWGFVCACTVPFPLKTQYHMSCVTRKNTVHMIGITCSHRASGSRRYSQLLAKEYSHLKYSSFIHSTHFLIHHIIPLHPGTAIPISTYLSLPPPQNDPHIYPNIPDNLKSHKGRSGSRYKSSQIKNPVLVTFFF